MTEWYFLSKNALYGEHLLVKQGKGTNEAPKHTKTSHKCKSGMIYGTRVL